MGGRSFEAPEVQMLQQHAVTMAKRIARELTEPTEARKYGMDPRNSILLEGVSIVPWNDLSLSHGYPGIALMFSELDRQFPDEGWDIHAFNYFQAMQEPLEGMGVHNLSLFSGVTGVALAVLTASRGGLRYKTLLQRLEEFLVAMWPAYFARLLAQTQENVGATMQAYDVIEGLSGIGRYLLFRSDIPAMRAMLLDTLNYLVALTQPVTINGHSVPGWYVPVERQYLESDRLQYPQGNFNVGMSHGIAGPLALLSLAALHGVAVDGQREAMERVASWLLQVQLRDSMGGYWPGRVSWAEQINPDRQTSTAEEHHRAAWCYGTPGAARSLWLGGKALGEERLCGAAVDSLVDCLHRPVETWNIDSPTFCHGKAGLLQITRRMFQDSGDPRLTVHVDRLTQMLLQGHAPTARFGFPDLEPANGQMRAVDKPGLLDGAAGVALVLLSTGATGPLWDSAFLLS
ncbi:MAG: lanthionine synthetase C family protein [Bacillota bacterium]